MIFEKRDTVALSIMLFKGFSVRPRPLMNALQYVPAFLDGSPPCLRIFIFSLYVNRDVGKSPLSFAHRNA